MGSLAALFLLFAGAFAGVPDHPPAEIALTQDEEARLNRDEVVVRVEASETGGLVVGIVDIDAPPDSVWAAVWDFPARVNEIGGLKGVETYLDTPEQIAARWTVKVLYTEVKFHVLYGKDRARGWSRYSLDSSQENDLVSVEGAYQAYPHGSGTRFVYRSITDSGRRVPQWIRNWLAVDSLSAQMSGIKDRAEGAASP